MLRSMGVTLLVVTLYVIQNIDVADAKHIRMDQLKVNHQHSMNEVSPGGKAEEPNLFDLLMSALSDTEIMEEEEAARRKQQKAMVHSGTKPCYWSLVSCYRRRRK